MTKQYVEPSMEVVEMASGDVVCTSDASADTYTDPNNLLS